MAKKTVFVLGGGNSSEKEISAKSAKFVYSNISREIYEVYLIMITADKWYAVTNDGTEFKVDKNNFSITLGRHVIIPDVVINMIHGTPGENGLLQGYFDMLNISYAGCSAISSALTFDKVWCKRVAAEYGVPLAKDYVVYKGDEIDTKAIIEKLGLPIFVKPSSSGSSFGVTKVKREEDIISAINAAYEEGDVVIIEEAIEGSEVACGIFITKKGEHFLPITEIVSRNEFFDFEAKYKGESSEITPARVSEEVRALLEEYSLRLYKAFRCRGIVRIDFIIKDGTPYMIEPNTIPGMSEQSIVPQQLANAGLTVNDVFTEIINY